MLLRAISLTSAPIRSGSGGRASGGEEPPLPRQRNESRGKDVLALDLPHVEPCKRSGGSVVGEKLGGTDGDRGRSFPRPLQGIAELSPDQEARQVARYCGPR